jgi:hypothetical protein
MSTAAQTHDELHWSKRRSGQGSADRRDRKGVTVGPGGIESIDHRARFLEAFDWDADELTGQSARLFVSEEAREGRLAFRQ